MSTGFFSKRPIVAKTWVDGELVTRAMMNDVLPPADTSLGEVTIKMSDELRSTLDGIQSSLDRLSAKPESPQSAGVAILAGAVSLTQLKKPVSRRRMLFPWLAALLVALLPSLASAQSAVAAWTSATAQDSSSQVSVSGSYPIQGDVSVTFFSSGGSITAGTINFEVTPDLATGKFFPVACTRISSTIGETSYGLAGGDQAWACPVGGPLYFRVRLNPVITGAGTANIRLDVASQMHSRMPVLVGKVNQLKTGTLTSSAATADQVVLTYTVTAGKTFFLQYLELEAQLTTPSATVLALGAISLETPSGTKVLTSTLTNPTTGAPDRFVVPIAEPIPVAAGVVIRVVVTPSGTTSTLWRASFGGYEK